jgi:hypothetical protein
MSLEHSPARQGKHAQQSDAPALKRLLTRDEVAARYRVKPEWVTRNYRRLGWRTIRYGKRVLFSEESLAESDARALAGEINTAAARQQQGADTDAASTSNTTT